jgi:serine protease inhibitor
MVSETAAVPEPPPAVVVNVDHPFLFAIEAHGAILFTGAVTAP